MAIFAFWNAHKNSLTQAISDLAHQHNVDVLILAESDINVNKLLAELNAADAPHFQFTFGLCKRIKIYTKFSREFIKPVFESDRLTVRHLQLPAQTDILLAAIHFPSKLFFTEASQTSECFELARSIRSVEEKLGHTRTILVGDFNMNPLEENEMVKTDLWPNEFCVTDENVPVAILREQASLLSEKTGWKLQGLVSTRVEGKNFENYFHIVAPALDDYHYRLFKVKHGIEPYPLWIDSEVFPQTDYEVSTADDFLQALKTIFSAEPTKKLIGILLKQIDSY